MLLYCVIRIFGTSIGLLTKEIIKRIYRLYMVMAGNAYRLSFNPYPTIAALHEHVRMETENASFPTII